MNENLNKLDNESYVQMIEIKKLCTQGQIIGHEATRMCKKIDC